MRRALACLLLLSVAASCLAVSCGKGPAQVTAQSTPLPRANMVVSPRAYVSLQPVPRGRTFELALVAKIRPGFHINAHEVLEDYLIPTALEAELPAGFRALETVYPPGVLRKLRFSATQLSVYEDSVTLRMKLQAQPDAPLGPNKLPLTLRYQACNEEACLPPVKLPVTAEFEIAPAGAAARPANPDIFAAPPRPKTSSPNETLGAPLRESSRARADVILESAMADEKSLREIPRPTISVGAREDIAFRCS